VRKSDREAHAYHDAHGQGHRVIVSSRDAEY
jgi:hypothetical protein